MDDETISEISTMLKGIFNRELAQIMAGFLWEYFNELKKVGFTEEQAMILCRFPEMKNWG